MNTLKLNEDPERVSETMMLMESEVDAKQIGLPGTSIFVCDVRPNLWGSEGSGMVERIEYGTQKSGCPATI
jgi:hypothetical protein